MIVVPVIRASLRPLSLIIVTTNFLSDHWISQIKEAKESTTQMGKMRNTSPSSPPRGIQLDKPEKNYHVFCRNRNRKEHEKNGTIWEEPTESEEDAKNSPRCPNHW